MASDLLKNVTREQVMKTVRTALQLGGFYVTLRYGVDKATVAAQADAAASSIDTLIAAGGALLTFGTWLWGVFASRPHGIIAQAADLPQVAEVSTVKASTAEAIPSPKVVAG